MTVRHRRRRTPAIVLLLVVLALVAMTAASGCAKQTQSIHPPTVGPSPAYDRAALERALDVIGGQGDRDGWRHAVVLAEVRDGDNPGELLVVTGPSGDTEYLSFADVGCKHGWQYDEAWRRVDALLDPGDLIAYSTKGDDTKVCLADELRLDAKGAALPTEPPDPVPDVSPAAPLTPCPDGRPCGTGTKPPAPPSPR